MAPHPKGKKRPAWHSGKRRKTSEWLEDVNALRHEVSVLKAGKVSVDTEKPEQQVKRYKKPRRGHNRT
jgi:hypothetical protein